MAEHLRVQEIFIGSEAQQRLREKTVVVVGVGGLGSPLVQMAARSGIGRLVLIDPDVVSESNIGRQILYTRRHIGMPKVDVAAAFVKEIDPTIEVVAHIERLTAENVDSLLEGADLVLDGTDNYKTRFIMSRWCEAHAVDMVFGAVAGGYGMARAFPHTDGIYLHHIMNPKLEESDAVPTAESGGLIPSILLFITGFMWTEGLKMLIGKYSLVVTKMLLADLWQGDIRLIG